MTIILGLLIVLIVVIVVVVVVVVVTTVAVIWTRERQAWKTRREQGSKLDYKYFLSVGAMFKNEGHILQEWLSHYRVRGVDHFYLINDNSNDNYLEILKPWITANLVTLFHVDIHLDDDSNGRQIRCYERFFKPILTSTKWLAILDLDEFLYSPSYVDLTQILRAQHADVSAQHTDVSAQHADVSAQHADVSAQHTDVSQIEVNWVWFGSNRHIKQPRSVVEGFTQRAPFDVKRYSPCSDGAYRWNGSHGPKCIVLTVMLKEFGIHRHQVYGPTVNLSYRGRPNDPLLLINHYAVQSRDFWLNIKATRGDANRHFPTQARNLDYFHAWDINDIPDHTLLNQSNSLNKL